MTNKYLRNRPFIVVEFTQRPRPGTNTKAKGWMSNPSNLQTFENVSIVDRVNDKQMRAGIVIDVIDGIAIRNVTGKPNEEVISHYIGRYSEKIKEALQVWAQNKIAEEMKRDAD